MTVTTRSLRTAFSLWVTLGLLAAAMPCAWVCSSAAETPGATAGATPSEHCAKRAHATPEAPTTPDTPCEEDCPGCAGSQVSIPSTALALDATSAPCSLSPLAAQHAHTTAFPPAAPALRALQWAGDLPPPDILALTTTLLI